MNLQCIMIESVIQQFGSMDMAKKMIGVLEEKTFLS